MAEEAIPVRLDRVGAFQVGAIVTRLGSDRQRVVGVNTPGDLIEVECIVPDSGGCFRVGDRETNVPWRYERATL